jgi:hypothetical protein
LLGLCNLPCRAVHYYKLYCHQQSGLRNMPKRTVQFFSQLRVMRHMGHMPGWQICEHDPKQYSEPGVL